MNISHVLAGLEHATMIDSYIETESLTEQQCLLGMFSTISYRFCAWHTKCASHPAEHALLSKHCDAD